MRVLIFSICGWCLMTSFTFEATYYGDSFNGNITKSGEIFNNSKMTCASNYFPIGTKLKVINPENGKSVVVRVNDTGAMSKNVIDLSKKAFGKIAEYKKGRVKIKVRKL